jgi:hypothetical protein
MGSTYTDPAGDFRAHIEAFPGIMRRPPP